MLQLIMRVIFKSHRTRRRPFCVLLRNTFLRNALHYHFLPLPQLANHRALSSLIGDHGVPNPLIRPWFRNDQVSCINLYNIVIILRTLGIHHDSDGAIFAILVAIAISSVKDVFYLAGIQRYETEPVSDKLIGKNGSVDFDFDKINGHGWDFSENYSAEGVCESEIYVAKGEVDTIAGNL